MVIASFLFVFGTICSIFAVSAQDSRVFNPDAPSGGHVSASTATSLTQHNVNIFDGDDGVNESNISFGAKSDKSSEMKESTAAAKSQKPFAKSGKSKTTNTEVVDDDCIEHMMDEPHKLFAKHMKDGGGKGSSSNASKSTKSSAVFDKAGKSKGNKSSKKQCETVPTSSPTPQPSNNPSFSPTPKNPFFFGTEDGYYTDEELGLDVSKGLDVRVIARTGEPLIFSNGTESGLKYHTKSDAAAIISMDPERRLESGYVYVVNSEAENSGGGVYGIYFDPQGNVLDYKQLLAKTTRNCGGGVSPWNTFISCEEWEGGQCWQIDPVTGDTSKTTLGGNGGRYESVAVDNSIVNNPVFFTTEDHNFGALRRFVADGNGWDSLHRADKTEDFLNIIDDSTYEWTSDENRARASANQYYPGSEGIQFHEGKLYFMAKTIHTMFVLDVDTMTYSKETTGKKFYGDCGSFENEPDQTIFGPTRRYLYFTEDGGNPGVFARYGEDGTYFSMFQATKDGPYLNDETVGVALSPDHRRFYAGIQHFGIIFEFTRKDGLPFE